MRFFPFSISMLFLLLSLHAPLCAQELLTIDRIYQSNEFQQEYEQKIQWIENGAAYVTIEKSDGLKASDELVRYSSLDQKRSLLLSAKELQVNGKSISIESFSFSPDGSKVLIFNNSSRVWRSFTKGDYWVYDLKSKQLKSLGNGFPRSSLMFAKFSADNRYVAYVQDFNIYREDFGSGEIEQLTFDGGDGMINGTFDWAYEEEFGKRDGFSWSPDASKIVFWQIDATKVGTHFMINNIDSVYAKPIPLQYPKVGQDPSGAKIGWIDLNTKKINWIPIQGDPKQNYLPGVQWVHDDLLLIQQLNRKQNQLLVWSFQPSTQKLRQVYSEKEETWVELSYPDLSASGWNNNDLPITQENRSFLRMAETKDWRRVFQIDITSGNKTLLTPGNYDVASLSKAVGNHLYFMASPQESPQRYLYHTSLNPSEKPKRITPANFKGVNGYNISPNGAYAVHVHESTQAVRTVRLISLPDHKLIKTLVDNRSYEQKMTALALPKVEFRKLNIAENIEIDVRMIFPPDFDESKKYPVLFHVYGEPWGQVAIDKQIGLWNIMMAQKGYVIIDMDNRGTPCLKGSAWRKSIYKKVGVLNTDDQAKAAKAILKLDYLDADRTAVWGWSGGGSMTLNLLFRYPEIYKTGVAIAAVSDQLIYDNIYQERYMGLPQEDVQAFINGSPVTHAKNLEGKLLLIHGTGDDNVHYQSAEILIDELIKENKQFDMMAYPNRSHGIYERENTRRHLFTLISNFIFRNTPVNK